MGSTLVQLARVRLIWVGVTGGFLGRGAGRGRSLTRGHAASDGRRATPRYVIPPRVAGTCRPRSAFLCARPAGPTAPLLLVGDLTHEVELLEAGRIPGVGDQPGLRQASEMVHEMTVRDPRRRRPRGGGP